MEVWAGHPSDRPPWPCPDCGKELGRYDHAEERTWRHLDSRRYQTRLHARAPRVDCPEHGSKQVKVPWAEPKSRFTLLSERLAIDALGEGGVSGAAKILGIRWDEGRSLMERAVHRGRARKAKKGVRRIGVDEKAVAKGHKYMTLACDSDEGTVEHVAEDRRQGGPEAYFDGPAPQDRAKIEAEVLEAAIHFHCGGLDLYPC